MKARISPLGPGEELIDAEIFHAFYSKIAAEPTRTSEARRLPLPAELRDSLSETPDEIRAAPALAAPVREKSPLPGPARPPSAATAAALEAEIDRSTHREHVARLAVHLARAYVSAAALLRIHRGVIHGVCGEGVANCGKQLLFPSEVTSPFAEVVASHSPVRGLPPQEGLGARILGMLGRESAQEIAVLPIVIQGRVVGLLYADNGAQALADASFAALQAVCTRLAKAYERLILTRKRDSLTASALSAKRAVPVWGEAVAPNERGPTSRR
ncbi:MAG TPA: hypothetical protein VKM54_24025 [Myxococcota bacterium]|nr:hypothetical protein [Myxococcota bacterium]